MHILDCMLPLLPDLTRIDALDSAMCLNSATVLPGWLTDRSIDRLHAVSAWWLLAADLRFLFLLCEAVPLAVTLIRRSSAHTVLVRTAAR